MSTLHAAIADADGAAAAFLVAQRANRNGVSCALKKSTTLRRPAARSTRGTCQWLAWYALGR
jgi:hypothetical protein